MKQFIIAEAIVLSKIQSSQGSSKSDCLFPNSARRRCTLPYGRFPHLIGQSGGGKGTLGRFWSSLFGEDGSSEGDFSDISTPEGRHQNLSGKRIFAVPDTGGYVRGTRACYELVDNGRLNGRALL